MKKIFAIIISLALLSTASVTAFAASPITAKDGSDSAVVKGTYVAGDASATVYSVDIAWGSYLYRRFKRNMESGYARL